MKLYIAYGSNMNVGQMAYRCPGAEISGQSVIENYKLVFRRGVANIEPCQGCSVPIVLWRITKADEISLDRYEGYPRFYVKQDFTVKHKGRRVKAMAYVMSQPFQVSEPSEFYVDTIMEGYEYFGIDHTELLKAAELAGFTPSGVSNSFKLR